MCNDANLVANTIHENVMALNEKHLEIVNGLMELYRTRDICKPALGAFMVSLNAVAESMARVSADLAIYAQARPGVVVMRPDLIERGKIFSQSVEDSVTVAAQLGLNFQARHLEDDMAEEEELGAMLGDLISRLSRQQGN